MDDHSHGTHVAGTIAGDRVAGQPMFGNAYGAKLYAATTNFAAGDFLWFKDVYIDGDIVATSNQNIVDLANTGQVRIINNSWGVSTSAPYTLSLAQAELNRYRELRQKNFVSQALLESKEAAYKAALANHEQATVGLKVQANQSSYTSLIADADGVVTGIDAEVGQVVLPGMPVITLRRSPGRTLGLIQATCDGSGATAVSSRMRSNG